METIQLLVLEHNEARFLIAKMMVKCEPCWTVKRVMEEAATRVALQRIQWHNIKIVYEHNGRMVGPTTLVKTLLKRVRGRLVRLRLLLSLRGGPEMPEGALERLINAHLYV